MNRPARFGSVAVLSVLLAVALLAVPRTASATSPPCDATIYGMNASGAIYSFNPTSANPYTLTGVGLTVPYGTIARGTLSGNLYDVAGSTVYTFDLGTKTQLSTTALPGANSFIIASGFGPNGVGYAMSTTQAYKITETASGSGYTVSAVQIPAPQTAQPPALSSFNGGDLAVDAQGNGWIILSDHSNYSYLYQVTFSTTTTLTQVAEITLNGSAYKTADLYSLAFGNDGTLYATGADTSTLYAIDQSSGALTTLATQSQVMDDFGSCPFGSILVSKNGPIQTAPGEIMNYVITVTNTTANPIPSLGISDTVSPAISNLRASCTPSCTTTINGAAVTATMNLPANSFGTLTITGKNSTINSGTLKNTAYVTNGVDMFSTFAQTTGKPNILSKTITNVRTGATGTSVPANPGDILTYTLSYQNLTNATIPTGTTPFQISDVLPGNVTYVASSAKCITWPSALTCTPPSGTFVSGNTLTWSLSGAAGFLPSPTLGATGYTLTVSFQVKVS